MTTLGWLLILTGLWLLWSALRGQVLDPDGKIVLLDRLRDLVVGVLSGDRAGVARQLGEPAADSLAIPDTPRDTPRSRPDVENPDYSYGQRPAVWAKNPRTEAEAFAWAQSQVTRQTRGWYRRCLAFVGQAYGLPFTGTAYAIDMWSQVPASMRHTGRDNIPAGALLIYRTGQRAGHIALYAGQGVVYSTDIGGKGLVAKTTFNDLVAGTWRLDYVGWIPPYFPRNPLSRKVAS